MGLKNLRGNKKNYKKMAKKAVKSNGVKVMKPSINPQLKSYVKKIVKGTEEIKFHTSAIATANGIVGSGFNTTGNKGFNSSSSIIPTIQQGVGQQQRIGNKIKPVGKLVVKGFVVALPANATNNPFANTPFYVRVVIWRQKQDMTSVSNSGILDSGVTGTGNDFDGTLYDIMTPFNKDKFEIGAVRTFMLQPNATTIAGSSENLSKYPVTKFFKMYVKLPQTLLYNDTVLDPQNSRWYMSAGVVNSTGGVFINSYGRAQITADAILRYTDA